MTDLVDRFDKALAKFEPSEEVEDLLPGVCEHLNTADERGVVICTDCGQEVERTTEDQEWCSYGSSDGRQGADKNRVQKRKVELKNIFKDVEGMGFSDNVVNIGNKIFCEATPTSIVRGDSRKSRVFASIYYAFMEIGDPQPHDKLLKVFGLDRKGALSGMNYVCRNSPRTSKFRIVEVTPAHLTDDIMDHFKASSVQKKQVRSLYALLENTSATLNGSRPQSVASALVWYYIRLKQLPITLEQFAKKVDLSGITIQKRAREIALVFNTPHVAV